MDSKYLALGSACAAVAVSLAYIRCRGEVQKAEHRDAKPSQSTSKVPVPQRTAAPAPKVAHGKAPSSRPAPSQAKNVTAKSFDDLQLWAAGLKKRDANELPTLLVSIENLLLERPDHEAMPTCLKALVQLVAGHQEPDRVSRIAIQAATRHPEQALEVLNALFKDRRQRGGFVADPSVIDFALQTLRNSMHGGVERGVYQRACRLLDWLSNDQENREELATRGGFETLLQVMETFNEDPGVLLEGCGCLQHLIGEKALDIERSGAIAVSCLEKFPTNPELQWRAMAVLEMLPLPPVATRLHIAKLACAAAKAFPRCDTPTTCVEWTGKLLHKLAKDKQSEVHAWLKSPEQKGWLEWYKQVPYSARGKVSPQSEHWVKELCRLVGA